MRIGFEREVYLVMENDTITTEVCARVTDDSPILDREVEVQITSSDGSAVGRYPLATMHLPLEITASYWLLLWPSQAQHRKIELLLPH